MVNVLFLQDFKVGFIVFNDPSSVNSILESNDLSLELKPSQLNTGVSSKHCS